MGHSAICLRASRTSIWSTSHTRTICAPRGVTQLFPLWKLPSNKTPRSRAISFWVMWNACRLATSASWLKTNARPFRFAGNCAPEDESTACWRGCRRSAVAKDFSNALASLRTCPASSFTSRLRVAISERWFVAVLRKEVIPPLLSLRAMRAPSDRTASENAVMVCGPVAFGLAVHHPETQCRQAAYSSTLLGTWTGLLAGFLGLALGGLGIDNGFELGTRNELRHGRGWDLQGRARGGVLARARGTLGGLEGAETHELNGIAFLHGRLDGVDQGFENGIGGGLGQVVLGREDFNELGAIQRDE